MTARQHSRLVNLNRLLILVLSLAGLLMNGYQSADLPCAVAVVVWLWLPLCTRVEERLIGRVRSKGRHQRTAKMSSPV